MATPPGAFRAYLVTLDSRHTGVAFAATSAGLLRSANGGAAWNRVSRHVVKSIAFDLADPYKIYFASTTGGLLMSRDGGNTSPGIEHRLFKPQLLCTGRLGQRALHEHRLRAG